MFISVVCLGLATLSVSNAYSTYLIPEPTFEAFSPKGLRVSIPDDGIDFFEFHANLARPIRYQDSGEVKSSSVSSSQGYWIFWSPEAILKPGDNINYWITVRKDGVTYRKDNGVYIVKRVTHLPDSEPPPLPDCDENVQIGQIHTTDDLQQEVANKLREMTSGARQESYGSSGAESRKSYESSYSSTHQHSATNSQPIIRSSSSSLKGHYYIKPTGIEGSGVQTSSSYDSTQPDGNQWQHSRREMTAEELARHPHLQGLSGLTTINKGDFPQFPASGRQEYHQSYYKKETTSNANTNAERPAQYQHSYFQTVTPAKPKPQYYQSSYFKEETVHSNNQQTPQHTVARAPTYNPSVVFDTNRDETLEVNRVHNLQGVIGDRNTGSSTVTTPRPSVPVSYAQTYSGSIFQSSTSAVSSSARTPAECSRVQSFDIDVRHSSSTNFEKVAKELSELRCLSNLLESTFQSEIRELRRQNDELSRRYERLEDESKNLRETCECVEKIE